eukprot:1592311-Prymnesium_polylepis.1
MGEDGWPIMRSTARPRTHGLASSRAPVSAPRRARTSAWSTLIVCSRCSPTRSLRGRCGSHVRE